MPEKRNSYLVSKALKTFMLASVLASLAQRLATMTDAIVVSNQHFIDIHIRYTAPLVTLLLKDDCRPFNPLLGASDSMDHLGLRLVNRATHNMTYQYMYDQNMVFIKFPCNQ